MKVSTINEIKVELEALSQKRVLDLCLRLARYKTENKELLTYLLFDANDEAGYIEMIKKEIDDEFGDLPKSNLHLTKKSLRKILRQLTRYIRHTGSKETEVQVLLYFCTVLAGSGIPVNKTAALTNLYNAQLNKIGKSIQALHEDLQYQYNKELDQLANFLFKEDSSLSAKIVSFFRK